MLRRWLPLIAVGALLTAAFFAASYAEPQVDIKPFPTPGQTAEEPAGGSASPEPAASESAAPEPRRVVLAIPRWLNRLLTVVCLVAVALVAALLLWFVLRDTVQARGRPVTVDEGATRPATPRAEELAAALDAGLDELSDLDADPRRAVIACWVKLEQAAAGAGTPRQVSDAPADYVHRLLGAHLVSRPVLDHFAAVYRQARYSSGPVDEGMRAAAVSALTRLRAELTAPVSQ